MERKEIINIIDEVIGSFSDGMKEQLSGQYKSLDIRGVDVLLNGIQTGLFKKIAMYEEKEVKDYIIK